MKHLPPHHFEPYPGPSGLAPAQDRGPARHLEPDRPALIPDRIYHIRPEPLTDQQLRDAYALARMRGAAHRFEALVSNTALAIGVLAVLIMLLRAIHTIAQLGGL